MKPNLRKINFQYKDNRSQCESKTIKELEDICVTS